MRFRLIVAGFVVAILGLGALAPQASAANRAGAGLAVTGTVIAEDGEGTFAGVATDLVFMVEAGQVVLAGELVGVITFADGTEAAVAQAFAVTVAVRAGAECGVLVVDAAAIVVAETGAEIDLHGFSLVTAASGSGGLLGSGLLGGLLGGGTVCEITRLLENPLRLNRLVNELNEALEDALH